MDFRLSENEQMIFDMCSRFAREQLAEAGAEADRSGECPGELLEKGAELGLFLDAVPEAQGGYLEETYSQSERAVRLLALSQGCPAVTLRYEANTEYALGATALGEAATATLEAFADPTTALACTVLATPEQPLLLNDDKLQGTVSVVPNAVGARNYLAVSHDGADTPFVAVCDNAAGVSVEPSSATGLRAAANGNVHFTDVKVLAAMSGEEARPVVDQIRNSYRLLAAAIGVGAAQAGLDYAEAYAAERVQFGQAIGKFESMARLLEENRGRLTAANYLIFAGAQALDHGEPATELCRQAAAVGGEAAVWAAIDAVQIYGGYGYVNEYPVEKIMRDTRACTTLAGDGLREQVLQRVAG